MKFTSFLAAASMVLLVAGCMRIGLSAVNFPNAFKDSQIIADVAYGVGPRQKLDIYLPPDASGEPKDVIVFFYGGKWQAGEKKDYRFVANAFAKKGFITVIPDYRLYPQAKFPAFVQDGAKALAWVHDHIGDYHGNAMRIHVAGHSAGAHIGALLAADERYLRTEGKTRGEVIHDFAGLAGPYDFTPDETDLKAIFGPPDRYPAMQVTNFIDGGEPPMLLLYGGSDTTVERYNLDRLVAGIRKKNGCYKSIVYPRLGHVDILLTLSWVDSGKAPVLEDMARFFRDKTPCRK